MPGQRLLSDVPLPLRYVVGGVVVLGVLGALAGLIVGLIINPPTAWFAIFELGVPAATAGALIGLIAGLVALGIRRVRDSDLI